MPLVPVRSFAALAALATLSCALCFDVHAINLPTFPITDPGPSATAWYTDRYTPAGFVNAGTLFARDDVLAISLAAADAQPLRTGGQNIPFYNTQGRKVDVGIPGPVSWIASLYVPASWGAPSLVDASGTRRSDLWATVSPATGGSTCVGAGCNYFPIIGFSNAVFPDAHAAVGGTPRFRVFDGNNGGWIDLGTSVAYDAWTDVCVTFTGTAIEYRVGNTLAYTASDLTVSDTSFGPLTQLANVMAQAYNYGASYDTHWSRFAAGAATCAELRAQVAPAQVAPARPVPLGPASALGALVAIALVAQRRRWR